MELEEEQRLRRNWRGRRLLACRAVQQLQNVIEELGTDDGSQVQPQHGLPAVTKQHKDELCNLATVLLRLTLQANDGSASGTGRLSLT